MNMFRESWTPDPPLNILAIGAHFDDCDIKFGGTAVLYAKLGHNVRFHSLTNGEAGHHKIGGIELTNRRYEEAKDSARIADIDYSYFDIHEGELMPSLENRKKLIQLIRDFNADIVLTHRPNDYHPDHRYGSRLVRDSTYMVTVPSIVRDSDALDFDPVVLYFHDEFEKPYPFECDIIVDIDSVIEKKLHMLHQHESQMYEWLPYNTNKLDDVPEQKDKRLEWLKQQWITENKKIANEYREQLIGYYGESRGDNIKYAEAFEVSEYGSSVTEQNLSVLFPFLNNN